MVPYPTASPGVSDSHRRALEEALLAVERERVLEVLKRALDEGVAPLDLAENCVTPVLESLGAAWESGHLALSQIYMAGRLSEEAVQALLPSPEVLRGPGPSIALALLEDFHALGKRMVQVVLRSAGYACEDYGRVTVEGLLRRVQEEGPDLVLISTLMFRSALQVEKVKAGLLQAGLRTPVHVGGAPFRLRPGLWKDVGADGWGRNASDVLRLVGNGAERRP